MQYIEMYEIVYNFMRKRILMFKATKRMIRIIMNSALISRGIVEYRFIIILVIENSAQKIRDLLRIIRRDRLLTILLLSTRKDLRIYCIDLIRNKLIKIIF